MSSEGPHLLTVSSSSSAGLAKLIFVTYDNLEQMLQPLQKDDPNVFSNSVGTEPVDRETKGKETKSAEGGKHKDAKDDKDRKRTDEMRKSADDVETIVNTKIISASVNNRRDRTELAEPMLYTLEHKTVSINRSHPSVS